MGIYHEDGRFLSGTLCDDLLWRSSGELRRLALQMIGLHAYLKANESTIGTDKVASAEAIISASAELVKALEQAHEKMDALIEIVSTRVEEEDNDDG